MCLVPAGLHSLAFFCGTALLDLISVIARALVFAGILTWMVGTRTSMSTSQYFIDTMQGEQQL